MKKHGIPLLRAYITHLTIYRTAQNFDGGKFDEFPAIRQYFPYQNFLFS